jgi:hypothetical protein
MPLTIVDSSGSTCTASTSTDTGDTGDTAGDILTSGVLPNGSFIEVPGLWACAGGTSTQRNLNCDPQHVSAALAADPNGYTGKTVLGHPLGVEFLWTGGSTTTLQFDISGLPLSGIDMDPSCQAQPVVLSQVDSTCE